MGIDEARNGFFFSVLLVGQRRPYKEQTSTIIHRAWMMRVVAAAETAGVVHQWSWRHRTGNVLLHHPQQKEKRLAFPQNQSHKSFSLLTAVIIQTTTTTDKKRKKRIDGKLFPLLRLHKNTNENKRTAFRRRVLIHHRVCVSVWIQDTRKCVGARNRIKTNSTNKRYGRRRRHFPNRFALGRTD